MTEQEIIDDIVKSGIIIGSTTILRKYGCSDYMARKIAKKLKNIDFHYSKSNQSISMEETHIGISEEQLRSKYDTHFIVTNSLNQLKDGIFYTNSEFMQLCGLNHNSGFKSVTEKSEFDKYKGKANGVVYWSTSISIEKMKKDGILR